MPLAIEALTGVTGQHLVKITAPNRDGRIEVTDPRTHPPSAYWRQPAAAGGSRSPPAPTV